MPQMIPTEVQPFVQIVKTVVQLLVQRDYAQLDRITHCRALPSEQIMSEFRESGLTLVMPPLEAFECLEFGLPGGESMTVNQPFPAGSNDFNFVVYRIERAAPQWAVDFALWTQEEGLSDFFLQLDLEQIEGSELAVELDAVHIL